MAISLEGHRHLTDLVEIGRGGFATVYRATDLEHGRDVAVKVLHSIADERAAARFERERSALGRLSDHPNIVTLLDSGRCSDGRLFLVMELLRGGSLADVLAAEGPLDADAATQLGIGLCGALAAARDVGVIHRDIKPDNILRTDFDDWQLADFGVVLLDGAARTQAGELVASLAHAAPELFSGAAPSPAADQYSLASSLYTALTGVEPFAPATDESAMSVVRRIASEPVPDARRLGVADELCRVLETALAKDPQDRYPSAMAFADALNAARTSRGMEPYQPRQRRIALVAPTYVTAPLGFEPPERAGDRRVRQRVARMGPAAAAVSLTLVGSLVVADRTSGGGGADEDPTTVATTASSGPVIAEAFISAADDGTPLTVSDPITVAAPAPVPADGAPPRPETVGPAGAAEPPPPPQPAPGGAGDDGRAEPRGDGRDAPGRDGDGADGRDRGRDDRRGRR